jgi:hypothetical protein
MRLRWILVAIAALAVGMVQPVQAGPITSTLVANTDNTYEDVSREAFIDVNGDGKLSAGDVIVGYTSIDRRTSPSPGFDTTNQIYGIFSLQVGPLTGGSLVQFVPTTAPGLSLAALGVAGAGATDVLAAYDKFPSFTPDLITTAPPDLNANGKADLQDYLLAIEGQGTLELTAGLSNLPTDFFVNNTTVPVALQTTAFIAAASNGTTVGVASAAMALNINNTGVTFVNDTATAFNPFLLALVTDQLELSHGGVAGAVLAGPTGFTDASALAGGLYAGKQCPGPCGFTDNADFIVHPIPAPGPLTLLGAGFLGISLMAARRRLWKS